MKRAGMDEAVAALRAGRAADAVAMLQPIAAASPDDVGAHFYLGCALMLSGRSDRALDSFTTAARLAPDVAEIQANLGTCQQALGNPEAAAACFARAVARAPGHAVLHGSLGQALQDAGRLEEAEASLRRAVALAPTDAALQSNLGTVLRDLGRLDDAIAAFERACTLDPGSTAALSNLGPALAARGDFDPDAELARYRRALERAPADATAHDNLLMALNYDPDISDDDLAEVHRAFGRRHDRPAATIAPHANDPDPDRHLRIGFVSADLRRHPVGYFVHAAFERHDRTRFGFHVYDCGSRHDDLTQALQRHAQTWRMVRSLSPEDLAAQVRADAIDILVDLAGHTGGNRLPAFARKPAPVQVSWIGYFATTGLTAMDYVLTDAATVPPGAEARFTETVMRLPGSRFCYTPPAFAPAPVPPPLLRHGFATFGSFNHLDKLSPRVAALWARVLNAVPGSRLVLKWATLAHAAERERVGRMFAAAGLDPARLELRARSPHPEMLAQYGDIDVALDPFPFSGGLTSCEALWMGVPVVTLPAGRPNSRQTLALLRAIGLEDLAAESVDGYVARARDLVANPERLAAVRGGMRRRMAGSPLMDQAAACRNLEAAFRDMWQRWCAR